MHFRQRAGLADGKPRPALRPPEGLLVHHHAFHGVAHPGRHFPQRLLQGRGQGGRKGNALRHQPRRQRQDHGRGGVCVRGHALLHLNGYSLAGNQQPKLRNAGVQLQTFRRQPPRQGAAEHRCPAREAPIARRAGRLSQPVHALPGLVGRGPGTGLPKRGDTQLAQQL
ncbi:hypothetical protein H9L05_21055 (plasmid) [Hymenobacter qilianensis]|uniref:Uncharacterized protein n=1 Tax=Hymenobacter qilianensis TaxID=1385715 RepID=A0A7H0H1A5_9BACT|nr:hypothetical protein [Hymenobacter qilianensis]QNP54321.1 hypothetical protein H9L05_21055 [Hymenobacter qilianensis]